MKPQSRPLAGLLVRSVTGPMWHGSALAELLNGITPERASARPIAGAHTIWELVIHITVWADIARARLKGQRTGDPTPEQDWPPPPEATAAAWAAAKAALHESYRALAADVESLDDHALDRDVTGHDYSLATLLHGVVEHGTYHGGQIALLKKI